MQLHLACAAGFERIVAAAVAADLPSVDITSVGSGHLTAGAPAAESDAVAALPYLAGAAQVLAEVDHTSIDDDASRLARELRGVPVPGAVRRSRSFRTRVTDEGRLVSVDEQVRRAVEKVITRWSGLRLEPRGGGIELWITHRRDEPRAYLAVSLLPGSRKSEQRGALKSDVAAALVRALPARSTDVVLDPFAGSGAILRARADLPHASLIGADADEDAVVRLRALVRSGALGGHASALRTDLLHLPDDRRRQLRSARIDTVITDPPWGVFAPTELPVADFYRGVWDALAGFLAPRARAVVLTGAPAEAQAGLALAHFAVHRSSPVLINGRKAAVLVATMDG